MNAKPIANTILKHGSSKQAASELVCAQSYLLDAALGEWVYALQVEDRIKIGYTNDLVQRVKTYRTYMGGAGTFIFVFHGSKETEGKIHDALSGLRIVGEWYYANRLIYEVLESYKNGI